MSTNFVMVGDVRINPRYIESYWTEYYNGGQTRKTTVITASGQSHVSYRVTAAEIDKLLNEDT